MTNRLFRKSIPLFLVGIFCSFTVNAKSITEINLLYVKQEVERPPVLSNLLEVPEDQGLSGAQLAVKDSNTTGRFTKQKFNLKSIALAPDAGVDSIASEIEKHTEPFVLLDLPSSSLELLIKNGLPKKKLLFNVGAADNRLRTHLCADNLLHTLPSRAMLTDALAQYMVKKRWTDWFLIEGPQSVDKAFSTALARSAKKFGAKIVKQTIWDGARDARRTAQAEVPRLTQKVDYDILMVADEWGDFGEYLMYRTWDPKPVAGTQGLFPTGWYWTIEQWGAAQMQKRFFQFAKRSMNDRDYAAWAAVRSVSEAATRTKTNQLEVVSGFIQSEQFELAAYKGRKLSYRSWSGQLRQPIAVTAARSLVTQSPQEGYLHRITELDTLGFDQPEVNCKRNVSHEG